MKKDDTKRSLSIKPDSKDPESIRQYYQRIIDTLPNNVYWLDRNCITLGCNSNTLRLIGLDKLEEFVGINYETMGELAGWAEGQAQSFKRDDMEVMETGVAKYNVEEPPLYDEEGNPIYYMSSRVPFYDEEGNVIGVVGISIDITRRKLLEEKLRASEARTARFKAMSSLGAMIAHELRTPLTALGLSSVAIKNMLPELIEGYERSNPTSWGSSIKSHQMQSLKKSVNNMHTSIKYAQMTIDMILAGFHSQDIGLANKLQPFSIRQAVMAALDDYPFDQEECALCDIKKLDDVTVNGFELMLVHVIHNLLKNAFHIIQAEGKGRVVLHTEVEKEWVYLIIEDTAKGIPTEEIPLIFDAFYTTKKETSASIGMGLYFSKIIMEKMGGGITCESELDAFTRFTLKLPRI